MFVTKTNRLKRAEFGFRSTMLLTTAIKEVRLQPYTCIPARGSAGTKDRWQQTNHYQLCWHLLKENICPGALRDKVFVTQEIIYSLVIGVTCLQWVPICCLNHVTHKWGDSEESHKLHNLPKVHSLTHPCPPADVFTTLLWDLVLNGGKEYLSYFMYLIYYHHTILAELRLRFFFFFPTL